MFNPDRSGKKIPEITRISTEQRIRRYAEQHFAGRYTRLDIRFRGQFCYIDAYKDTDDIGLDWPLAGSGETPEQFLERLKNTPTHLCRLRYFGTDRWGFGFYSYSDNQYKPSVFPSGDFVGTPEQAFHVAAQVYLCGA